MKQIGNFLTPTYYPFYGLEPHFCFHLIRGCPFSIQDSRIISKAFETDSPHILSIQILITSWLWALLRSRSRIIWAISLLLYDIDEINFSDLLKNVEGSLLEQFIKEHCSAKKELNISVFSLKSVTSLFWWLKDGIQGIFLLFKNIFKVDK